MARITVEDLKRHYSVDDHQLQLQCLDQHLEKLAHKVPNWLSMAMALGLEDHQQQAIKVDLNLDYLHKNLETLKVWKKNVGRNATYLRLVKACLEISNAVLAGEVCELAKTATTDSNPHSLRKWFRDIGLTHRDTETLEEQGFSTRQAFSHLTRPELNNLGLTRGGMRILDVYIQENEQKASTSESQVSSQSSGANLTEPPSVEPPSVEPPSVEPPTDHLSPNTHLRYVFKHTYGAHTKWFNTGLQLGLAKHTLDNISRNRSLHDDGDYYREMLTSWMHGGQATMEELVEVLKGPTVGMEDVAKHVETLKDVEKRQIGLLN